MNTLSKIGLAIFYVGIIVFFIKQFMPHFLSSIDDIYINVMWPIGLLLYSVCKAVAQKQTSDD